MDESTSNKPQAPNKPQALNPPQALNTSAPWEDPTTVIGVSPARLLRTIRHLRPQQWIGQVRNRVRRSIENPTRSAEITAPETPACGGLPLAQFIAPCAARFDPAELARGVFNFVGEARELGSPPNWETPSASPLWAYNLHYFEVLWSLPFKAAADLVLDWIARHTLDRGRVGWEPYPTSLRLQNWCAYFYGNHRL